ncbi:MAG TPA: prepilin-type N-terminal cleavage/methylation domain-containing protein [Gemmatimonadaceae bacterium]|nr:prepilin-type N-terminal cleavage/methylation domain-containing protein [Gemmatimonadaceae bacterium]
MLPRRDARGFSLVELLVAMVVVGILVGLAIPRYNEYKRRFYLTTMVTDLRNLATTEEAYWNLTGTYSTDLQQIQFTSTPRVSISMVSADTLGWAAKASYDGDTAICAIYYGNAPVLSPASIKNVIGCTP